MDINKIIEKYQQRKEERAKKIDEFFNGDRGFLVVQKPPGKVWERCNEIKTMTEENIIAFEEHLGYDWTDDLPYLEPWFGVGVYANAFGCEYMWREGESPATHYKYHKIEEVKDIEYPDWRKSSIMQMVLDGIDDLKEKTKGRLPICLTDTQSPFDTATLILDAAEFFTACYTDEEIALDFMGKITDLIIEFSKIQEERIGREILSMPGHIMTSETFLRGISLSDDNLAVSSPMINEKIALPFNEKIGKAFGGLAVHSCGQWVHTMKLLQNYENIFMMDCAASLGCDPNPNKPSEVKDAMKGTGIITKVRISEEDLDKVIDEMADPDLKFILHIKYPGNEETMEKNYKRSYEKLSSIYG
jgi:hypothetical protein